MNRNQKVEKFIEVLGQAKEGQSVLQINRLQGVFKAILIKKNFHDSEKSSIDVRTLDNKNPDYEKGLTVTLNLNDGGLIEIIIV